MLADQWGEKLTKSLSISDSIRRIDPDRIAKLLPLLQEKDVQIYMRHGEQQKSEHVRRLPSAEQKIEMMRSIDNIENPLTKGSLAELMEGMIVWQYLKEKTNHSFTLESSKNRRAETLASTLGFALKITLSLNDSLNCVNYPSSHEMPNIEILKWLPDGTLPWEKEKVDAIIGSGVYEQIIREMECLLCTVRDSNTVYLAVTHTQQINAVAALSDLPIIRLGNYEFVLFTDQHKELFSEGFYKK